MSILHSPETRLERRVLTVLVWISGIALALIGVLYILEPRSIIGDSLVNTASGTPFEIPPPGISPIHVKPVTVFYAAVIVFSYCSLSLVKQKISRLPGYLRTLLLVFSVLMLAVSTYEILFNFTLWTVVMLTQSVNPDHAINNYPGGIYQINLVFATKTFVAILFVSYFAVDSFRATKA